MTDLGTSFVAKLLHELTDLLEIKLKHASLKHPQTIGVVERSHSALKRILKLNTDEKWTTWYKYTDLATFIHNTSYHSSIGCTPSSLFHGREPMKPIDLRFRSHALAQKELTSDYLVDLQDSLLEQFSHTKSRLLTAYHKYRTYYDKKAAAKPLVPNQHCLLLNPSLLTQSDFAAKSAKIWLSLYKVEKVLTNSNYLIRKIGTPYTQCVHRIRLRPISPKFEVDDTNVTHQDFKPDPSLGKFRSEYQIFDEALGKSFTEDIVFVTPARNDENQTEEVEHTIRGVTPLPANAAAPAGATAPAPFEGADPVPRFPPPPASGPKNPVEPGHDVFPEPTTMTDPIQMPTSSSQLEGATDRSGNAENETVRRESPKQTITPSQSKIPIPTKTTTQQRLRFDNYDHFRDIPTRRALAAGGYPECLNKEGTTPQLSQEQKRQMLRNIAHTTRPAAQSSSSIPNINKQPGKSILKKRYPERWNRGIPGPSNDVHSANFQLNMFADPNDCITLPTNVLIKQRNLLENKKLNFAHCVSSDLSMSAGIATQFLRLFPELKDIRSQHPKLPPGSLLAHFSRQNNNWIYNLVTKANHKDKPTYSTLHKCLCRMKSHMLVNGVREINLPQIGCGLDKLEWKNVLILLIHVFSGSGIQVNIYLRKIDSKIHFDNALLEEQTSPDEDTRRHIYHMATARRLALEGMLQSTPNHVRNDSNNEHPN